ncbi:unnamed protein product [Schistosoma curassoni]|uniref:Secreted protein n=1 Tax=Schistosoma curassoni TaxID=6186 RepID=A0A183JYF9_9TREM|nr:unnamed protein product [Schistosoma curassoni]
MCILSICIYIALIHIAQASGYQDSVAKWITRWCLKRNLLDSSPRVNINSEMQVHPADESQIGRNAHPGFHC